MGNTTERVVYDKCQFKAKGSHVIIYKSDREKPVAIARSPSFMISSTSACDITVIDGVVTDVHSATIRGVVSEVSDREVVLTDGRRIEVEDSGLVVGQAYTFDEDYGFDDNLYLSSITDSYGSYVWPSRVYSKDDIVQSFDGPITRLINYRSMVITP